MDKIHMAEGFHGQIMHVVPRPLLDETAKHLLAGELHPTDIGWYPHARHHYRERTRGTDQHILIYCTAGRGWFEIDGHQGELYPRQALLIPRGRPHSYAADERRPWTIHWVHFTGEDAAYFSSLLPAGLHVIPVAPTARPKLERLFHEGCAAFANGFSSARILYAAQVLRHLLAVLFFDNPAFAPGARQQVVRDFSAVIDFMRQHIQGGVPLRDVAKVAGLSVARFSALFKAQTGVPPGDYYLRLRVQAACRLLDTTPLTVKEIAATVGCADPYYFSRLFHKVMGMPPTIYRRAKKG